MHWLYIKPLGEGNSVQNCRFVRCLAIYTIQGKLLWSGKKDRSGLDGAISDLFSNNSLRMMVFREK